MNRGVLNDSRAAASFANDDLARRAGECESCGVNLAVGWHYVGCEADPSVERDGDVRA